MNYEHRSNYLSASEMKLDYNNLEIPEFNVKGIYVTGWAAGNQPHINDLIKLIEQTELNSMVIDIKDEFGYMSYISDVENAKNTGANKRKIKDIENLLERLNEKNIYTIGRLVVFQDRNLAVQRPYFALPLKTKEGEIIFSREWVDPYIDTVREYNIELAAEAFELGFDEVQFDYIRYPVIHEDNKSAFSYGERKVDIINQFAAEARKELAEFNRPLSIDVFGLTTTIDGGMGIGQSFRDLADEINIISPMVYPSHYFPGSYGFESPAENPYEIIYKSITDAIKKVEDTENDNVIIRPWLQDFSLNHRYTAREVRDQIRALDDLGIDEWLLWNPRSRYTEGVFLSSEVCEE